MDKLFDLGASVAKKYWTAFAVAAALVLAGSASPVGLFDFAIASIRYLVVGILAGWPVIGGPLSQAVAFLAGVWAIAFVFGILAKIGEWVFGGLRKAEAE